MSTLTAHFDVPLGIHAPAWAREVVAAVLLGWGFDDRDWRDDATLIVSELVTNAVRHGGGGITLEIEAYGSQVVLSVADGSAVVPRRRDPDETGGRGLTVIETLATRWQVRDHNAGKRVRVQLRAHPHPSTSGQPTPTTRSEVL